MEDVHNYLNPDELRIAAAHIDYLNGLIGNVAQPGRHDLYDSNGEKLCTIDVVDGAWRFIP
jgi:hypothetical protein